MVFSRSKGWLIEEKVQKSTWRGPFLFGGTRKSRGKEPNCKSDNRTKEKTQPLSYH